MKLRRRSGWRMMRMKRREEVKEKEEEEDEDDKEKTRLTTLWLFFLLLLLCSIRKFSLETLPTHSLTHSLLLKALLEFGVFPLSLSD